VRDCAQPNYAPSPAPHRNFSMNLFTQLKNAIIGGDDAPTTNDVRPFLSTLVHGAFEYIPQLGLRPAVVISPHDANNMRHQTDHALSRSHDDNELPSNPFAPASSDARHSSPHIDLTSPPRESAPRNQKGRTGPNLAPHPTAKDKRSLEERRLIADYEYGKARSLLVGRRERADESDSTPADAVFAPDPTSYFTSRVPMGKVGSWDIYLFPVHETDPF